MAALLYEPDSMPSMEHCLDLAGYLPNEDRSVSPERQDFLIQEYEITMTQAVTRYGCN